MLSVSDTPDSINEHTQEINSEVKLHILEVWQHSMHILSNWLIAIKKSQVV